MNKLKIILSLALAGFAAIGNVTAQGTDTNSPAWLTAPLSLADAFNIALTAKRHDSQGQERSRSLKRPGGADARGRAAAGAATGQYKYTERGAIESYPRHPPAERELERRPADRADHLRRRQAARGDAGRRRHQAAGAGTISDFAADTLLAVRLAYYDTLLAAQQITVHEASVNLLQKELEDQQHRLDAGTVPNSTCCAPKWPWPTSGPL